MKPALLTVLALILFRPFAYPDFYVSPRGSDARNGLTENTAFRTLARALAAARESGVKRIVVLGSLDAASESGGAKAGDSVFYIRDTGSEEILITGAGTASGRAELRGMEGARVLTVRGGANIRLENLVITDGDTPLNGGGVYMEGGARLTLGKGAAVRGNRAQEGGGLYVRDGVLTLEGDSAVSDNAVRTDEGGGVLLVNTVFTMRERAVISGNSGGGAVLHDCAGTLLDHAAIRDNRCLYDGGGIVLYRGELFIQGNAEIRGNQAGRSGGGVVAAGGTVVIGEDALVADNRALGDGGGVMVYRGSGTVRGRAGIERNSAGGDGGGVYGFASDLVCKENARVSENTALCGGGVCVEGDAEGAVFTHSSFFILQDKAAVLGNSALGEDQGGGGLCAGIDAAILMKGGEVRENRSGSGGGVYLEGGAFKHSGGVIADNTARHGGGVYKKSGRLRITGGDVSGNAPNDIVNIPPHAPATGPRALGQ
jgi:hypothetical protein